MERSAVTERCIERALGQWGVITLAEALECGMSPSAVRRRVETGRWICLHRGVYRLREVEPSWQQALMAGCRWAGPTAAASHRAAARLHGLGLDFAPTELVLDRRKKAPPSLKVHFTDAFPACDVICVQGIPVTTPSRTLIDLGAVTSEAVVERALESALRQGLTSVWHLIGRLDELGKPGRNGVAAIRSVLRARDPRLAPTGSELESMLSVLIGRSHLPAPERQFNISDADGFIGRTDFAYPAQFLVLEVQSARWHLEKDRWLSDMERRNRLMLLGWRILEIPWQDIVRRPGKVIERIDTALRVTAPAFRR
ncbi:MAG: type IV toxin-antitoxin system AbiEi family antitoxin domain-containing protein [Actinomycetota bacterium]